MFDPAQNVSSEHTPLSAIDEFMIHNAPQPQRVMYTSDPRAYERVWFTCQDRTGDLFVAMGMGFYPNLDTADAYAIVNLRGQHTTVRAHRRLGDSRTNMRIGPIHFELVEAFKHWRLRLDENEYGIAFDLHWYDTKRAVFHNFGTGGVSAGGRLLGETTGYETFGRPEGELFVQGERFEITRDAYTGSRDHHWGIRDGVGGPGHALGSGASPMGGQWVEFGDWSIWGGRVLYNLGDPRPGAGRIVRQQRRLRFHPQSHVFEGGIVTNTLANGEVKQLHWRRLGSQTAYLRCGMYGGRQGGTPEGDIWWGMYVGDDVVSGETYDTTDPAVQARLAGLDDHHCEVTCDGETAYGIFEPYDPVAWEACRDERPGFSLLEP